ncbi:hypothetical protein VP01_3552g1 [Puccinia sorghi]|uniref:Uncharacterized protein n=1 Tax=Puccinia sorghi TaxID=27349 RepID=A0A0L6UVI3_9BASI|nr:hypothetical protein VP01_3552g1 [Puccinia sorghi]
MLFTKKKNCFVVYACFARKLIQVATKTQWSGRCMRNFKNLMNKRFLGTVISCILTKRRLLPQKRNKSNKFDELTQNVCIFFFFSFLLVANTSTNKLYFTLEPLISVYGFRWKIKYESRRHAYNAREIIDAILWVEFVKFQDQITRQSRKQNSDWMQIKHLNDDLSIFLQGKSRLINILFPLSWPIIIKQSKI